jgi:glycosyltransferase involved in cell wall biosynthesis
MKMKSGMVRVDLHVHSKFSTRPSQWVLQKLSCPESFTEPLQIYKIAKSRGMSLVTISDHNTIDGALEIAHLPDTFISEEITTYFPEDGCKVHVLALNITEKHHQHIQSIRENIFDLVDYLNQEKVFHVLAHPIYSVNDRLTIEHFEQMLLLFKNFELNGARGDLPNQCLQLILPNLVPEDIERLAEKHNIWPPFPEPWRKNLTGGSDDHSSLNIARTYTEIEGAEGVEGALKGIENHRAKVVSRPSTPQTLAHNIYGIAYQFYRNKFGLERYVNKDILMKFLDRSLSMDSMDEMSFFSKLCCFWTHKRRSKTKTDVPDTFQALLRDETQKLICDDPQLMDITENGHRNVQDLEKKWFYFVNQASNKVLFHFANHFFDHFSGANVFNIFHTIGSAGGLYAMLAPYFVAFSLFTKDKQFSRNVLQRFDVKQLLEASQRPTSKGSDSLKIAHFTDTFYDVNGVALTLQQQVQTALRNNKKLTVITCDAEDHPSQEGIKKFKPIGVYELPEYEELKIFYPPFLEMLNYCYEQDFTQIHSATPGPIGLAALAIARILKLPMSGTYHTALPQYVQCLTEDEVVENVAWKYTLWYYDQMDVIYAPSQSTRNELIEKGIRPEKIRLFPRGIDIQQFHPEKRNGCLKNRYNIHAGIKLLYVGRVSKEKNLGLLGRVFKLLIQSVKDAHLIVVGDGPYLKEMGATMKETPCTFTGYIQGEELASIYASSDIFVFPSTTDTFGNVVLEAQASGLPVIVTNEGGPCENMVSGKTGLVVKANDAKGLLEAIHSLIADPQRVKEMSIAARQYMENHSFERAFIQTWKMYKDVHPKSAAGFAQAV